jgi:hypothetical protein
MRYDAEAYDALTKSLRIDRDSLDEEAVRQPNDYFHASEGHVQALSRRDKLKHDLEVTVAELDKDVRDAMVAEGEKVTEAQVKAQITREQDYHRAQRNYLDACLEADRWEALRNAYRQRADMLKSLVQLYQSSYFGEVAGSAERREARGRFDDRRLRS